jgi:hypothetical protein
MPLPPIAAGAVASGSVAAYHPPTVPAAPSLPLPPSPSDMPQLWDSIKFGSQLGDLTFGPAYGDEGRVEVEIESSVKLDKQKSAGKSKSKTKVGGKEDIKGKLRIKGTGASWPSWCRITMQLDPQGPLGGTPLTTDHPEFMRRTGSPTIGQTADRGAGEDHHQEGRQVRPKRRRRDVRPRLRFRGMGAPRRQAGNHRHARRQGPPRREILQRQRDH